MFFVFSGRCMLCLITCRLLVLFWSFLFFFKQKTAYEMRISDWSSDVCSSDLYILFVWLFNNRRFNGTIDPKRVFLSTISQNGRFALYIGVCQIGRASCRERVCQYV